MVSHGWKGLCTTKRPFSLFPSCKTRSNRRQYFLTDVCLDLFLTENLPPPQAIYSNVSFSSSALYTHAHVYSSQKVSRAVSDDLHIKRLVNSFLTARSLLWMIYEPWRSQPDPRWQAELGGPADGVRGEWRKKFNLFLINPSGLVCWLKRYTPFLDSNIKFLSFW